MLKLTIDIIFIFHNDHDSVLLPNFRFSTLLTLDFLIGKLWINVNKKPTNKFHTTRILFTANTAKKNPVRMYLPYPDRIAFIVDDTNDQLSFLLVGSTISITCISTPRTISTPNTTVMLMMATKNGLLVTGPIHFTSLPFNDLQGTPLQDKNPADTGRTVQNTSL